MQAIKRFSIYAFLIFMVSVIVGVGFQTAEKGMQALVGTDGPPKTIHFQAENKSIQVTVLGKQVSQPKLTLGDKWSKQLESSSSAWTNTTDNLIFKVGQLVQKLSQKVIEWIGAHAAVWVQKAISLL